jgi:hypothetical protein
MTAHLPGFLSRFEGASCPAPLLESLTLVDTPGVLSGEKQRIERNYAFVEVLQPATSFVVSAHCSQCCAVYANTHKRTQYT